MHFAVRCDRSARVRAHLYTPSMLAISDRETIFVDFWNVKDSLSTYVEVQSHCVFAICGRARALEVGRSCSSFGVGLLAKGGGVDAGKWIGLCWISGV